MKLFKLLVLLAAITVAGFAAPAWADSPSDTPCSTPATAAQCSQTSLLKAIVNRFVAVTATNSSTTVTTGGTFQTVAAANAARKSLEIVNACNVVTNCTTTSNYCYVFIAGSGSPSKANAIPLAPGQGYLRSSGTVPSDAIQATCDGTGDKFYLAVQ